MTGTEIIDEWFQPPTQWRLRPGTLLAVRRDSEVVSGILVGKVDQELVLVGTIATHVIRITEGTEVKLC